MRWSEFRSVCPELADIGQRRLEERYLCLIGTLRRDGWPRISPVEPFLVDGDLMMGMMKGSRKAADLLRDPRLVVHSIVTSWDADEGDVKLYGTAQPVTEPEPRNALFQAITQAHGWSGPPSFAEDPAYPVYRMDIDRAAYVRFDGSSWQDWTWDPRRGLSKRSHG
ncbi:MAG: pyridoxamine 5'-phosphate oxidase family protein [Nocardiopsaceae bacterium]|nr:pyridoxamine 5'-phosphate oxidase family protein [Nocardiopsaceae bacterium]